MTCFLDVLVLDSLHKFEITAGIILSTSINMAAKLEQEL